MSESRSGAVQTNRVLRELGLSEDEMAGVVAGEIDAFALPIPPRGGELRPSGKHEVRLRRLVETWPYRSFTISKEQAGRLARARRNDRARRAISEAGARSDIFSGAADDACSGVHEEQAWFWYAEGFRRTAEILARRAAVDTSEHDVLVYPFLYSCRHHIELIMKYLIVEVRDADPTSIDYPHGHDLNGLWATARPLVERGLRYMHTVGADLREELPHADLVIREFARVDPGSFSFRYPTGSGGAPMALAVELRAFKPNHTFAMVERFSDLLMNVSWFSALKPSVRERMDRRLRDSP